MAQHERDQGQEADQVQTDNDQHHHQQRPPLRRVEPCPEAGHARTLTESVAIARSSQLRCAPDYRGTTQPARLASPRAPGDAHIDFIAMDPARARELLARERSRIEEALARLQTEGPLESDSRVEPDDLDSEDLYQDEFDQGRREDLEAELSAVERAEARLEAETYGLSVDSGEPIPDGRLEAIPWAERTVEEEERLGRRLPPDPPI